jgi:CheY-like chemotaxis protein
VATHGAAAVALARQYRPSALTLDIRLPDIDGWRVLHHLKSDLSTRHVPVMLVSTDDVAQRGLRHGAFSALQKPVSREALERGFTRLRAFVGAETRRLLVVEDDPSERARIVEALGGSDVQVLAVASGEEAIAALAAGVPDCVVLDLGLGELSGMKVVDHVQKVPALRDVPLLVHTARDPTPTEEARLRRVVRALVRKGPGSLDTLLDESSMYLHRAYDRLAPRQRAVLERLHARRVSLDGRTILVVDDDVRNIYAMTSILEQRNMRVLSADNGRAAIEILERGERVDAVLMDIMMPGMDGFQTMMAVRAQPRFRNLPIIALTAKAMKGDREKCIESGASDYLAKPVDREQLLAVLGVWLWR